MEIDDPGRGADTALYTRCLAFLEADQIGTAERQARRIEGSTLRTIAQDQIRFVLEIKACLASGDKDQARRLCHCLIGGIKRTYEAALGIRPIGRTPPPHSLRPGAKKPSGKEGLRQQLDTTDFPPEIRSIVSELTHCIERARGGEHRPAFSLAVMLQLGWIAHRAWRRSRPNTRYSPFRADASEIRIAGACLRQRIERGGGPLSIEALSAELGVGEGCIRTAARNLRQFLLRGSGWRMVGDAKTGLALELQAPDILPDDRSDRTDRSGIITGHA